MGKQLLKITGDYHLIHGYALLALHKDDIGGYVLCDKLTRVIFKTE
jgi:hypothetical protein